MNPLPRKLSPETTTVYNGGPESARRYPSSCEQNPAVEPDLAAVMDAWPNLPSAIRAGILAMIESATTNPKR